MKSILVVVGTKTTKEKTIATRKFERKESTVDYVEKIYLEICRL